MSDYSQMGDDELNCLIAERLGWTAAVDRPGMFSNASSDKPYEWWHVQYPDGTQSLSFDMPAGASQQAALMRFFWSDDYGGKSFATDLNAAAELLKDSESSLRWTGYQGGEWRVEGNYINSVGDYASPSRGVAEDYMTYTDAYPTPAMLAAPDTTDGTP